MIDREIDDMNIVDVSKSITGVWKNYPEASQLSD